ELVGGYQLSQIVAGMVRLDFASHVANGKSSSAELAQLTGEKPGDLVARIRPSGFRPLIRSPPPPAARLPLRPGSSAAPRGLHRSRSNAADPGDWIGPDERRPAPARGPVGTR